MINFSMDFLCLFITAKLLCPKVRLIREVAAAVLGGAYAVAALFFSLPAWLALTVDIATCFVIVGVAFLRWKEPYRILLYAPVFAAVSMLLGGVMTALFNLLNKTGLPRLLGSEGDDISVWLFALLAIVSGVITLLGGGYFKGKMSAKEVEVEITLMGKAVRLRGMCDSGNLLCDPIGGRPCIVADTAALAPILPEGLYFAARSGADEVCGLPTELQRRIILIPAKTATGESLLVGIKADSVKLFTGKRGYEVDAPVALTDLKEGAGENKILVPTKLLA